MTTSFPAPAPSGLSRRSLLQAGAASVLVGGGLALPFGSSASTATVSQLAPANTPKPFTAAFAPGPTLRGRVVTGPLEDGRIGQYRLFTVIQKQAQASILPGLRTPVYGYGYIDDAGVERPVRVPGPTIDVDRTGANGGLPVKVRVVNRLPENHPQWGHRFGTSTHLHGSASLPQYDGYADDVTSPGSSRTTGTRTSRTPGRSGTTTTGSTTPRRTPRRPRRAVPPARQGPGARPAGRRLRRAAHHHRRDVLRRRRLAYDDHEFSGLWGDVILVNGQPWPVMQVHRRVYRFRVLNASIARSLRLHLSDRAPFAVVGTDGGLMPAAVMVDELRQGGAERYEILVDFSRYPVGATVDLLNRSNRNNVDYDHTGKVMRFKVVDGAFPTTRNTMNPRLPRHEVMDIPVSEAKRTRRFELDHDDVSNVFKINGRTWEDVQDSGYTELLTGGITPAVGEVEIWEFANSSGGWFHPLHIHLVDFRILSRNGQAPFAYEKGPKDVVYIGEDETVRLLMKFSVAPGCHGGRYMVHCHNLPHEDHDMMQQFAVGDPTAHDPVHSAYPERLRGPAGTDGDLALYGDGTPG